MNLGSQEGMESLDVQGSSEIDFSSLSTGEADYIDNGFNVRGMITLTPMSNSLSIQQNLFGQIKFHFTPTLNFREFLGYRDVGGG